MSQHSHVRQGQVLEGDTQTKMVCFPVYYVLEITVPIILHSVSKMYV